ncbi:MAG TPA: PPOX class F420-dependent oxidoreductase [Actinomycetes bacterium]
MERNQPAPTERHPGDRFVTLVTLLAGLVTLAIGLWGFLAPRSFADAVQFPYARHFVHDAGAFQVGIGATLLLALAWRDGLALALAGFLVGNTVHALSHVADRGLGGGGWEPWALAAVSVVILVALVLRLRAIGWVVGEVPAVAAPELARFARQKTAVLTSYRRDGTPVATPLSVVVDGDRLLIRSYQKSGKARRIRRRPEVEIAPSTARGRPTGPATRATARLLDGADARRAAWLLNRKYPGLHGIVVTWGHRLSRAKVGATIHYELVLDRGHEPILEERDGATVTAERNETEQGRRREPA